MELDYTIMQFNFQNMTRGGHHDYYCSHFRDEQFDFMVSNIFIVLSYVPFIKKYIFNKYVVPLMCSIV